MYLIVIAGGNKWHYFQFHIKNIQALSRFCIDAVTKLIGIVAGDAATAQRRKGCAGKIRFVLEAANSELPPSAVRKLVPCALCTCVYLMETELPFICGGHAKSSRR